MRAPAWICLVLGGGILCSWERFGCVPLAAIDKPSLRTLTDEALVLRVPEVDAFAPPPAKPPPPPPVAKPDAAPLRIVDFVRAQASDPGPWQATLYRLREPDAGEHVSCPRHQFMGRRIVSEVQLPPPRAARLIERLAQPASYENGRNGCISIDSVGLRITRAREHLFLVENCGHLFLTPDGWDGEMAVFSEAMALELQSLVERFL